MQEEEDYLRIMKGWSYLGDEGILKKIGNGLIIREEDFSKEEFGEFKKRVYNSVKWNGMIYIKSNSEEKLRFFLNELGKEYYQRNLKPSHKHSQSN